METLKQIEQLIAIATVKAPFWGSRLCRVPIEIKNVGTACTDGERICVDDEFASGLSKKEMLGLLVHEVLHILLQHHIRGKGKNPELWNVATDMVINDMVNKQGLRLPKGGVKMQERFKGMSEEEIYYKLLEEKKSAGTSAESKPGNGDDTKGAKGGDIPEDTPYGKIIGKVIQNDTAESRAMANVLTVNTPECGDIPKELERLIERAKKSLVDWRSELSEIFVVNTDYDWNVHDRRFIGSGVYIPDVYKEQAGRILVAIDSSGSMPDEFIGQAISEIDAIAKNVETEGIDVIEFDTKYKVIKEDYAGEREDIKRELGGGTDYRAVEKYVNSSDNDYQTVIIITDGYCHRYPELDVIWVVYNNDDFNPPTGRVINCNLN